METTQDIGIIIMKLEKGVRFGLYNNGNVCFFEDGANVHYTDLWAAIRQINSLDTGHNKTLFELYPDQFQGSFPYKFPRYRLTRKILGMIFGVI